jgi:hypothetical protein
MSSNGPWADMGAIYLDDATPPLVINVPTNSVRIRSMRLEYRTGHSSSSDSLLVT